MYLLKGCMIKHGFTEAEKVTKFFAFCQSEKSTIRFRTFNREYNEHSIQIDRKIN